VSRSLPSIRPSAKRAEWEGECFMFMKRILCAVLCLCLLATGCAFGESVGTLNMPNALSEIRAEAFCGDESIVSVTVPEGVKRIDSRAFAESGLKEIALPASLEYIADDAFEGCDDLVVSVPYNSYAHEWVAFTTHEYVVTGVDEEEQEAGQYGISAIEAGVDEETQLTYVSAGLITDEACRFVAEILDDSGEICLFSASTDVEAGLYGQVVRVYSMEELPVYFTVRAKLVDNEGNVLYEVRNIKYTDRYARYDAQTPADFPEDRVSDYGDSGYAVFAEGVIRVEGAAEAVGSTAYRFASDDTFVPGDRLMLRVEEVDTPVKVRAVTYNGDGTVTVEKDPDIYMADFFEVFKLRGYAVNTEAGANANARGNVFPLEVSPKIDIGPLTGEMAARLELYLEWDYDVVKFGKDYFQMDFLLSGELELTLDAAYEFDTDDYDDDFEFLKKEVDCRIPNVNIPLKLGACLKFEGYTGVGGNAKYYYITCSGFHYDTVSGLSKFEAEPMESSNVNFKNDFEFRLGPDVYAKLDYEVLNFRVGLYFGIELIGKTETPQFGGADDTKKPKMHACYLCIDGDVNLFSEGYANLQFRIAELVEADLLNAKFGGGTSRIGDFYISVVNDEESIYNGDTDFGTGECENYKYLTVLKTADRWGDDLDGIPLSISKDGCDYATAVSPCEDYLYSGKYSVTADFGQVSESLDFSIEDKGGIYCIAEPGVIIDITVVDADTEVPIEAAEVVLTYEDGTEFVLTTDADGKCTFDKLGGGKYNVSVNKAGYRFVPIADMNYEAGTINCLKIGLEKTLPLIMASSSYDWQPAYLPGGLELPEGVPQVWVAPIKDGSSICGVSIRHEDCEAVFEYRSDDIYTWSADLYGFDMGDGEYTYLVRFDEAGTDAVGGVAIIVKVIDGKLELLKSFERYQRSDDIRFDAEFVSATAYEGVLYPSGNSIRHTYNVGEKDRTGIVITETTYGTMDYRMSDVGCYELIYSIPHCPYWEFGTTIGYSYTRYAMENGELVVAEQWYVPFIS